MSETGKKKQKMGKSRDKAKSFWSHGFAMQVLIYIFNIANCDSLPLRVLERQTYWLPRFNIVPIATQ